MIPRSRIVKGANDNIPVRVNLAAWYRFRRGITNQSGCSVWYDYSGNQRPLIQNTASARPAIRSSGTLVFDGTAQFMQATFTLAQPCTIYLLFAQISWTINDVVFDGATGTTTLSQVTATPQLALNAGSALTSSTAIPVGNLGVSCSVINGASSVYQSAYGGPSVTITGNAGANNPGGITLGCDRSQANFSNIGVREMAVYTGAHDATTRLNILRYLARIHASVGGVM